MLPEFVPNKSISQPSLHDKKSIKFLRSLFPDEIVDDSKLEAGGTTPNIDGYIDLLCEDGTAFERVFVQVKHLTYPETDGDVFYDIPKSLYAYAYRHKGEVVLFIACDYEREKFYWKYIDEKSIKEFINKSDHIRGTSRYHFKEDEVCTKDNIIDTLDLWRQLYHNKMASFKDDKMIADDFVMLQRATFNCINSEFHRLNNSHIARAEASEVMDWINNEDTDSNRLCLLVGAAGVGKSVIIKDIINVSSR